MKIKTFCMIALLHSFFFIVGTTLFILLFHTTLFKGIDVFFYRGIVLLAVSCILILLGMVVYKRSSQASLFTYRDVILSIVLLASINLVFFTHLPVTAERSISVFLLSHIDKHSQTTLTNQEITKIVVDKYLYEFGAIDKRLYEQIISGNIVRDGNGYKISKRGKFLLKMYALIIDVFNIDKKLISP